MNKVFIGYQGDLPVRVESSREAIENDIFLKCDRIVEHEGRAALVNGQVLFDDKIDVARAAETVAIAKAERAAAVSSLTVEVDDMVFDGDEKAQERMSRTITAATATGAGMDATTTWVLHDNTVATVTIMQLATALRLAGEAQTALWIIPYTNAA